MDEHFNQLDELASQSNSQSILTNCGPVVASSGGESVCSQIVNSNDNNSCGNVGNNNDNIDNVGNGNSINNSDNVGNVDNDNGGNVNFYGSVVTPDDASAGPGTPSQDSEMSQASGPRKRPIASGSKNKVKAKKVSTGLVSGSIVLAKKSSSSHMPGSIASAARLAVTRPKK